MKQNRVYLASSSPRRAELLDQIHIDYTIIEPDVDESHLDDCDPQAYSQRVAIAKAEYGQQFVHHNKLESRPLIAADTIVVLDNQLFGKPDDEKHAAHMLSQLSSRTHQVLSSIAVINNDACECITQISDVSFRQLSQQQINEYWKTAEPHDKAGAYAIQGIGAQFINHLSGSYSGVMGLPLFELTQLLAKLE